MFALKLNSILLPQFTDTLNIYPSPVYQVLNVNWSAFLKGISPTLQSHGWNNGTHGGRQLDSGDLYLLPLAVWPTGTVDGESYAWKRFADFANSVIVAKLFRQYILNSTGINSALLESRNFSTGMQSRALFAKLFPRVTFPVYGMLLATVWASWMLVEFP